MEESGWSSTPNARLPPCETLGADEKILSTDREQSGREEGEGKRNAVRVKRSVAGAGGRTIL